MCPVGYFLRDEPNCTEGPRAGVKMQDPIESFREYVRGEFGYIRSKLDDTYDHIEALNVGG